MIRGQKYPAELHERAVRLVQERRGEYPSEWQALLSISEKMGIDVETPRRWVRRAEVAGGARPAGVTEHQARIRELEQENMELRRANEILKAASAFFARELDPRAPRR